MTQHSTETETAPAREITFDVGGWATCSGASQVSVILNPEGDDLRVYTFNAVGSGTPMPVWHGRHRVIANVDITTVPDALLEALEERSDEIRAIAALYLGAEWDGSNHVGRWSDDGEERYVDDGLELGELSTYWDAGDWFGGDPNAVICAAIEAGRAGRSLEEIAASEVEGAAANDAALDEDDAEAALRRLLESHRDDLDVDDEGERRDRLVIAKLLGADDPEVVRCGCGATSGVPCDFVIVRVEGIAVEWMPGHLRSSHEAARNDGAWPHNGAERLLVDEACAERIVEAEPRWASIV